MITEAQVRAEHPNWTEVQVAQFMQFANIMGTPAESNKPTATNSSSTASSRTRLTFNSAKAMLAEAADAAGYPKTFSDAEINDYIKKFNAAQDEQIAKVITIASKKMTPDTNDSGKQKIFEQTMQEEFPSFFKPTEFAKDFIWEKVNFADQATLGAGAVGTLASIRGLVDSFDIVGMTEQDIQALAKAVAKGDKSIQEATVEVQQIAKREYPQFAERFDKDPTLTTKSIAEPIIKTLASVWEVDASEIKMSNPLVMKWMQGVTADGKSVPPTKYEIMLAAKKDPKYQYTQAANNDARDAATALSSALGYGV